MKTSMIDLTGDELFDPLWNALSPWYGAGRETREWRKAMEMRTDIKNFEDRFELLVDLPGVKKEDIDVRLEDGYLTVKAQVNKTSEEGEKTSYVRRERFSGSVSRSFYVGDVDEKAIKAKFEDGTLVLTFPKEDKKVVEAKHSIAIE